ncbi:MAG: fibronectin type III domain-containing protein, partial [Verrucomicrobia bacterium]|nr:fibronectin type III domain-containing protein [Verrucomicrobiota bacterium]
VSGLYTNRDAAAVALQAALRLLLKELGIVFDPLDPRWLSFGFKKPGAKQTPDAPENVSVVSIDEETAAIKWDPTPRAASYRVRAKVVGVDAEPVLVGSPKDPDFTMEALATDAEVEVTISAINSGGESRGTTVIIAASQGSELKTGY